MLGVGWPNVPERYPELGGPGPWELDAFVTGLVGLGVMIVLGVLYIWTHWPRGLERPEVVSREELRRAA